MYQILVSYHCQSKEDREGFYEGLKQNRIQELFPLFYLERIGCYNWGLVAGKYQTYEPIEGVWQAYERGDVIKWDFRIWMHDLFRPSFRPYDPNEINVIKRVCKMADDKWSRSH